jgi:hypothetical protein
MTPRQVELLLYKLCVDLGFCLPIDDQVRLEKSPGMDVDAFTDAVNRAEGLDPNGISRHLRRDMRARVLKHFKKAENDQSSST